MFAAADAGIASALRRLSKGGGGGGRGRQIRLHAAHAAEDLHRGGPLFHSFFSDHQETASAYGSSSSSSSNFLASVPLLTVRTYERTPENFRYGGDNVCRRFSLSLSLSLF